MTSPLNAENASSQVKPFYTTQVEVLQLTEYIVIDMTNYAANPQPVEENHQAKIYFNGSIIIDRTPPHNRPDIVLTTKNKKRSN